LKIKEEMGNKAGVAYTLGNIGVLHKSRVTTRRRLAYYQRSQQIAEEIGDKAAAAYT